MVITALDHELKNSLSQQWSLSVERGLVSNLGIRISYVGNKTSRLPWYNRLMNEPRVQSADAIHPRRPYQPWSTINLLATGADSILNQLQVEVSKRYSQGLAFQIQYAFNRSIDNAPIVGGPQDLYITMPRTRAIQKGYNGTFSRSRQITSFRLARESDS
jgi:hypothetical protein